jgi:hypothetical protein
VQMQAQQVAAVTHPAQRKPVSLSLRLLRADAGVQGGKEVTSVWCADGHDWETPSHMVYTQSTAHQDQSTWHPQCDTHLHIHVAADHTLGMNTSVQRNSCWRHQVTPPAKWH